MKWKAAMTLPEKDSGLFEQIDYLDLPQEEAEVLVAEYNKVGEGTDSICSVLDRLLNKISCLFCKCKSFQSPQNRVYKFDKKRIQEENGGKVWHFGSGRAG